MRKRWAGHVTRTRRIRNEYIFVIGKSEGGSDHLEDVGVEGRIV
jgi:hypothetical protein